MAATISNLHRQYNPLYVPIFTIKLKIVSHIIFAFKKKVDIEIENIKWTLEQENVFSCDIGINPVPENLAAEGKGSFKLLKYMAHGIPSVTSWTCDEFNRNEDTCLIASDSNEWYIQLKRLICDDNLRIFLTKNGIHEARKYSSSVLGLKYFEIITRDMNFGRMH